MQTKYNILRGKTRMLDRALREIEGQVKKVRTWVDIIREEIKKLEEVE